MLDVNPAPPLPLDAFDPVVFADGNNGEAAATLLVTPKDLNN